MQYSPTGPAADFSLMQSTMERARKNSTSNSRTKAATSSWNLKHHVAPVPVPVHE